MGVAQCVKHELPQPFNILYDKKAEFVSQVKFTVLLMPNGSMWIFSASFESDLRKSEMEFKDSEQKALLQISESQKTLNKKKPAKTVQKAISVKTRQQGWEPRVSLCSFYCPGIHQVDKANLQLIENVLLLPPEFWD